MKFLTNIPIATMLLGLQFGADIAHAQPRDEVGPSETVQQLKGTSLRSWMQGEFRPVNTALRTLLRDTVDKALLHSPELRMAHANEVAARYDIDDIKGKRWPQLQLGMDTALSRDRRSDKRRNSGDTAGTARITTKVWDWGQNRAERHSAEAELGSTEQSTLAERERIALEAGTELVNLLRYTRSMEVANDYVQQMNSRVDMLSRIVQIDRGRASELVQARAKLLEAQASRTQIENLQTLSRIKLQRLLGEPAPIVTGILTAPSGFLAEPNIALAALDRHPLLQRLRQKAKAEEGRADSIKAQGLPSLNLVTSKENALGSNRDRREDDDWYVGLDIQWQAFSGGSNRAAQAAANARRSAALEEYEQVSQDLREEVDRLVQSRDNAAHQAIEYQKLSVETDQVRKMFYEQWYSLGKRTLLDVLVAENDHFNSQLQAINSEYDSLVADLNILSSAGILVGALAL